MVHAVRIDDLPHSHISGHLDEKALRRWFQWPPTLGLHLKVDGMCTGLRPVLQAEPWRYGAPATLFPPGDGIPEDHNPARSRRNRHSQSDRTSSRNFSIGLTSAHGPWLLDQAPYPSAHTFQTKIRRELESEDDRLSLQISRNLILGHHHNRITRQCGF